MATRALLRAAIVLATVVSVLLAFWAALVLVAALVAPTVIALAGLAVG